MASLLDKLKEAQKLGAPFEVKSPCSIEFKNGLMLDLTTDESYHWLLIGLLIDDLEADNEMRVKMGAHVYKERFYHCCVYYVGVGGYVDVDMKKSRLESVLDAWLRVRGK